MLSADVLALHITVQVPKLPVRHDLNTSGPDLDYGIGFWDIRDFAIRCTDSGDKAKEVGKPVTTMATNLDLEKREDALELKFGGTPDSASLDSDNLRLAQMGYKSELRRDFSVYSVLAVGFSITNSWFGISASLVTGIYSGGTVVTVYGICLIAIISTCVAVSLAEMASAMPNAGGQYFWASELAPRRWSNFLAYMTGGIAWAGSVFTSASVAISVGSALVGVYQICNPDFTFNPLQISGRWPIFAAYQLVNIFAYFFNCYGRALPATATVALYTSLISMIVITITVLAKSNPKNSAEFVFATFRNENGWSSPFIAFVVGLINPNWSFACLDAATHLAEEVSHPEKVVPIAILGTVAIGFVTSFIYSISMFFSIKDIGAVYLSPTGVPILEIFKQALESITGAVVLETLIICTGIGLNAHTLSCVLVAILGLLYIASSTAFNSMITACVVLLYFSYSIPIVLLLFAKGRNNLTRGPFWAGPFGLISNYVVLIWTAFTFVLYSFPYYYPVVAGSMNYVSVVYFVVFSFLGVYWIARGRRTFRSKEERDATSVSVTTLDDRAHQR
ncbi:hypothetical protein Dda_3540 [Drechslerella dactyloides]|uniref:Choline transport protein n=1 Tax=Drechslerella dactyloides TaxID=74499 RepID=A0AAD6IY55_DREDA|nr:hypothetical protein Dda_3540 [Drechslerella dactyloides]